MTTSLSSQTRWLIAALGTLVLTAHILGLFGAESETVMVPAATKPPIAWEHLAF